MKKQRMMVLGAVAVAGVVALVGCKQKTESEPAGMGERTGAALDTAAEKTAEAAKATAAATKEATGKVVEKTGEALEKAGAAVERAGTGLREEKAATTTDE